jgi:hypothetical protein
MALVNPNIAISYRAPEIQQPNMLADYAAIQQIQGGRQAQELNALKMQEAQAALTERNALRGLDPAAADYENQLFRVNPTLGIAFRKERSAADASAAQIAASQAAAAKSGFDLKAAQRKFGDDLKRSLSANPSDENIIAFGQDAVLQGLYTPDQVNTTVSQLLALPLPDRTRILSQAGASAADLKPPAPPAPPSMVAEYTFAKTPDGGNFKGSFQDFVTTHAAAGRAPAAPRVEPAPTVTTVEDPNNPGKFLQVDARQYRGGGAGSPGVIGAARPSATAEKTTIQRAQMGKDLGFAITQLSDITKDGGLIDQSTGSGAGRLVDLAARFGGKALPGDIAIGKIAPIADLVLKMVPRFEGPQSNADTKSYKEAAGQLADSSLPTEIRKAAGRTVLRLMQERKDQFVTSDMAAEGTPAAAGAGVDTNNPLLK